MDLNLMREIAAFLLLIQWKTSDSASHSIVATCQKQSDDYYEEYIYRESNPSPLHNLTAELSESQSSFTIRWAINVDSTIRSLTGTLIRWTEPDDYRRYTIYKCGYKPEFSSDQISLAGLQQLWFSFSVPNGSVCPSKKYDLLAYNLPEPNPGTGDKYIETFKADFSAKIQWNAHISSVLHDDKITVSFSVSSVADRHTIQLKNTKETLKTVEIKGGCEVEKCQVEVEYTGPCEDLTILLTSHSEHCKDVKEVQHKVICTNQSGLAIAVGCVLALLFVLLFCGCIAYDLKSNQVPGGSDDTVSASASSLFALTLNLLSSAAHDPLGRDKFWVVHLRAEDQSERPELRGFRRFLLPRDSEKLHQQLWRGEMCSCFSVRKALEKMEIHTDLLTCGEDLSRHQTTHLLP
ncbi:uncharacterized protein LOC120481126 isoform X2 [Pimephales promelas]|uniref:uncharacterized protein LOC120481126 isoform X2 n=1 Tax=Pimephales promelas TaxID=90988 RepID=UPI0019554B33|nr:uncharacterized protein LOC120481126 isoform X2 [Pimephales promelas]